MIVIPDLGKLPIKAWVKNKEEIDDNCLEQAINLSSLPFAFKHIALMPDTHMGYGMPIGGILATENVIIPNAVGVDIGCGMSFTLFDLTLDKIDKVITNDKQPLILAILANIKRNIPVGFAHHKEAQDWSRFNSAPLDCPPVAEQLEKSRYQLGTLGGGNHFIELQIEPKTNKLAIMLHSGSRNFGKQICDYYSKLAEMLNDRWHTNVPKEHQLSFLPLDDESGVSYYKAMNFALDFAEENRHIMMERCVNIFINMVKKYTGIDNIKIELQVNAHHNYATIENHFGRNVMVHRKGAIRARKDDWGIIPGSMGTASYIVRGLGNRDSFCSASHGAGRIMGRKEAERKFTQQAVVEDMKSRGIKVLAEGSYVDECPWAYKNIDEVIDNEKDLVTPIIKLTQLGVIKG